MTKNGKFMMALPAGSLPLECCWACMCTPAGYGSQVYLGVTLLQSGFTGFCPVYYILDQICPDKSCNPPDAIARRLRLRDNLRLNRRINSGGSSVRLFPNPIM